MSTSIIMPQLGETVAEGKILTWFKSVGDEVREGDRLFEVETDKVTVEVEAIAAGILSEIRFKNGEIAKVGVVVAVVDGEVSQPVTKPSSMPPVKSNQQPIRSAFEEVATPLTNFGPARAPHDLRATPLARRLIAQNGLDLALIADNVAARGGKRIMEEDVRRALNNKQSTFPDNVPPHSSAINPDEVIPLSNIRQKTADRLTENWRNIPHVFQAIEVDFGAVETARSQHKEAFRATNGIALTYLPFIARATCLALREFPNINSRFDGKSLILSRDINLGIAIDLSHKGLVVAVVRNADELTVPGLAKAIGRLIDKARSGKLAADDLTGGTYSITNNGAFGTMFTAPIINAPQVAILSTDAIRKRPSVVETAQGEFIAIRPMGIVGQSFDHRAFDGAYSAAFLSKLKITIENRNWIDEMAS
jgi:pyruvate/2-oxoglutarate dehydrogenase complex dihydrolipoamide acyltransferase (E2) component